MRALWLAAPLVFAVACARSTPTTRPTSQGTAGTAPPVAPAATAGPEPLRPGSVQIAKDAPPGSSGVCRVVPKDDGGARSPAEVASCPDVLEMTRGDGIGGDSALPAVKPSVLPAWDLDTLRDFACAYACAPVGSAAHLLAWSVVEDDRPLRNHNAVFAVQHATATPRWSVVVMYRHATNEWWNINVSFHRPTRPVRTFRHAPTDQELSAMLDENDWQFAPEVSGFQLLAGNVVDPLWSSVTGKAPTRFFPPNIER